MDGHGTSKNITEGLRTAQNRLLTLWEALRTSEIDAEHSGRLGYVVINKIRVYDIISDQI